LAGAPLGVNASGRSRIFTGMILHRNCASKLLNDLKGRKLVRNS
jgi:hypothetical protein